MNSDKGGVSSPFVLKVDHLSYSFSGNQILDIPFLDARFEKILLVKGAVGAGKTHLLKVFAGALMLSAGSVAITRNDKPVSSMFIHSNPEFNFVTGRVSDEILLMGIDKFTGDYYQREVSEFSGGQLKKISIEMGVNSGKELLIVDEPFNMLDDYELLAMKENILEHSDTTGFIIAAHENILDEFADVVLVLEDGSFI